MIKKKFNQKKKIRKFKGKLSGKKCCLLTQEEEEEMKKLDLMIYLSKNK